MHTQLFWLHCNWTYYYYKCWEGV